ncbi:MAG: hypothetical protein IT207_04410 [Fimbriimonadaceae bacterium]|nr:hypothetical protein [Fimbriimonadaceae bacterium]
MPFPDPLDTFRTSGNTNPDLPAPIWLPGLAAFVLLDYRTGYDPHHLEQSVVIIPADRSSMMDLLTAPGPFMKRALQSFSGVKAYNSATGLVDLDVSHWPFADPITIHIEPLTSPTPKSIATLDALSFLYPGFRGLLDKQAGAYETVRDALIGFRNQVIAAAQVPTTASQLEGAIKSNAMTVSRFLDPKRTQGPVKDVSEWNPERGGSDRERAGTDVSVSFGETVPLPAPTFPLSYVAEFALDTRVLTIKYIPELASYPQVTDKSDLNTQLEITPMTINPIKFFDFTFMHFDIAFDAQNPRTHAAVASARACLAMDFIKNPLSLNAITAYVDTTSSASPYFVMNDQLTPSGNPLHQKSGVGSGIRPQFSWPLGIDPVVILDSVLPDPDNPPASFLGMQTRQGGGGTEPTTQDGNETPSPCVIVYYVNGVPYYVVIKNYN